jgi:hypothetical protein
MTNNPHFLQSREQPETRKYKPLASTNIERIVRELSGRMIKTMRLAFALLVPIAGREKDDLL